MPMRPLEQDVNSRRFDSRHFQEQRTIEIPQGNPHGNPQFRPSLDPRMGQQPGRGLDRPLDRGLDRPFDRNMDRPMDRGLDRPLDRGLERSGFDSRGLDRPLGHHVLDRGLGDSGLERGFVDPRHQHPLESRANELRTYDRPVGSNPRIDPRINFSVGLSNPVSSLQHGASASNPSQPPMPAHLRQQQPTQSSHQPSNNNLNNPFSPSLFAPFNRPSVTEVVPVHVDLATFAAEPKFQQILLKVKEQSAVNVISLNRVAEDVVESIVIEAPTKDAALLARNLIETHLKLQMKIKAAENRLQRVQTDLFSTQGEIAAGQMIEFSIQPELIGLAIGKKGSRIKQIETETGVSSINVSDNGKSDCLVTFFSSHFDLFFFCFAGHIMIYGPDSQSVQRAREQLELREESFPLHPAQVDWMSDKMNAAVVGE
jgi:hypothetical protein